MIEKFLEEDTKEHRITSEFAEDVQKMIGIVNSNMDLFPEANDIIVSLLLFCDEHKIEVPESNKLRILSWQRNLMNMRKNVEMFNTKATLN